MSLRKKQINFVNLGKITYGIREKLKHLDLKQDQKCLFNMCFMFSGLIFGS
jgi:hypothetical protein